MDCFWEFKAVVPRHQRSVAQRHIKSLYRGAFGTLAALGTTAGLFGCTPTLSSTQVSQEIQTALQQQGVQVKSVTCPQNVLVPPFAQAGGESDTTTADAPVDGTGGDMAGVTPSDPSADVGGTSGMEGVTPSGPSADVSGTSGMEGVTPSGPSADVSGTSGMEGVTPSGPSADVSGTSGMEGVTPSGPSADVSGTSGMEGVTPSGPSADMSGTSGMEGVTPPGPDATGLPGEAAGAPPPPNMVAIASLQRPFVCTGELEEGTFPILVGRRTEQGEVQWGVPNSKRLLNLMELSQEIAAAIAQEAGSPPLLDCGIGFRLNRPGESFDCTVTSPITVQENNRQYSLVTVRVSTDTDGNISWQQVRQETLADATAAPPAAPDAVGSAPAFNSDPFAAPASPAPTASP